MTQKPNSQIQYVTPQGGLTLQGMMLIGALVDALREQEAQIKALDDRVTALEP